MPSLFLPHSLIFILATALANGEHEHYQPGVLFKECSSTQSRETSTGKVGSTEAEDGDAAEGAETTATVRTETYLWMSLPPNKIECCHDCSELICKSYRLPADGHHQQWPEGSYTIVSRKKFRHLKSLCTLFGSYSDVNVDANPSSRKSMKTLKRLGYWVQSFFIYPGTLWCGKGTRARTFENLGKHHQEDSCCRAHDQCPLVIHPENCLDDKMAAASSGSQYFCNKTPIMMSHCECDLRFHRCLQQLNTSTAYTIGNLYFNVVGARCFANGGMRSFGGRLQAYTINFPNIAWGSQLYDMTRSLFAG